MNINPEPESQLAQPARKISLGLVSLVFALLTIVYTLISICIISGVANRISNTIAIVSVLSAIAIFLGGTELYLISRKIPIGPILALITVLAFLVIVDFSIPFPPMVLLLLWGFVYAIIQIILVIKNRDATLARLGIGLALLCTVIAVAIMVVVSMIMG